ncbi:hypothetical protein ACFQ3S_09950 [Mucilaginibacter terrae]|uniref:hypothetical protein n=1 Tax=Mucilaginibacter terrae TaxID=1955052 RepID=UPI00362CA8E7
MRILCGLPKAILLGIGVVLLPFFASAQTIIPITGITYNNKTSDRVAQVTITNLQHPVLVYSSDVGMFSITAAPTDTLLFSKAGFTDQRLIVKEQKQIMVFMVPALQLDEVFVKAKTKKQEQKEIMDTYRSKGIYYNGKPPALSFLSSPITGFYELFGKGPGQARHFAAQMQRENQQTEVNKRYTVELVKRITKLPDEEIQQFMLMYSPPYPEVLKWNDYEVILFINRSMLGYNKSKTLPPLPKLNSNPGS